MKTSVILLCASLVVTTPAFAAPSQTSSYSDRLAKLGELQRKAVIRRAIVDSGNRCKQVDVVVRGGQWKNLYMWSARCVVGGDFAVFIGPDGSAQTSKCAQHAQLGLPLCRLPRK